MCGISGIYGFKDLPAAEEAVRRMTDAIAHRGPDAEGLYSQQKVVLGHRRLAIIDTSSDGNQPFYSSDGKLVMVFNGEVYNYLEIRKELEAEYTFRTKSDTEVLLAAYAKWGVECLSKFIGMFVFAIWDLEAQRLFLVRDRLGIKPLYYVKAKGQIAFASEQRALLAGECAMRKIATSSVHEYVNYQTVCAPQSILEEVYMLPAGHFMLVDESGSLIHQYWNPLENFHQTTDDLVAVHRNIRETLISSVELRMRADVNYGAFLSGGIDSSAIVGLMSRISPGKVNSFSVTFYEKEFDESQWSGQVAKMFNTHHHEVRVSATEFLQLIPDALDAMDHPSGDGPNSYVVSKLTRAAGIKMALSGLGGDELFAGYDVFKRMKRIESNKWLNIAPRSIRKIGGSVLSQLSPSVASRKIRELLALSEVDFAHAYPLTRGLFSEDEIEKLIYHVVRGKNCVYSKCIELDHSTLPLLSKVSLAEMSTYMQNVLLRDTDQMSMAHALEVRVPFLDHRLVEYVLSVGDSMKYPHTPKRLLVDSLEGLLPRSITERPKMGFTFPWKIWMKNELRQLCEENLAVLNEASFMRPGQVFVLWNRFLKDDPSVPWSCLWHLVVLGHWMRKNNVTS